MLGAVRESTSGHDPRSESLPSRSLLILGNPDEPAAELGALLSRIPGLTVDWRQECVEGQELPRFDIVLADTTSPHLANLLNLPILADRSVIWIFLTDGDPRSLQGKVPASPTVYMLQKPTPVLTLDSLIRNSLATRAASEENLKLKSLLFGLKQVNAQRDLHTRLERILDLVIEVTESVSGSIMLLDESETMLEVAAARGLKFPKLGSVSVPVGDRIAGYVARTGYGMIINPGLKNHPFFGRYLSRNEISSAMSLPLVARDRIIGVLNINRAPDHSFFDQRDLDIGSLMAETLTLYIEDLLAQIQNQKKFQERERSYLLTEIASSLSHELRNPLAAMVGYAELMARELDAGTRQDQFRKVQFNANRIQKLVLDLKKLHCEEGVTTNFDLNLMLEDCVSFVRFQNPTNTVAFESQFDSSLLPYRGEEKNLIQVFINLINNALESMEGEGKISITSRKMGKYIEVLVRDTGKGIAAGDLPKIFSAFYTTKKRRGGTGMGLAIVKAILNRCGAEITAESVPGQGTTFSVLLPT